MRARLVPGDGDRRHGTYNGYNNLDCRCAGCRAANVARQKQLRARRASLPLPGHIRHGHYLTYGNYGCRCQPCTNAHSTQRRNRLRALIAVDVRGGVYTPPPGE